MAADSECRQEVHRAGPLKQKNKTHSHGQHRTKGQIKKESSGRVSIKTLSKKQRRDLSRVERRHQNAMIRKQKREEVLAAKRDRGSGNSAPTLVMMLPLNAAIRHDKIFDLLRSCDESATVLDNDFGLCHISLSRFKRRLCLFAPRADDLHAALDTAKVADVTLCVLPPNGEIDEYGEMCLECLYAQGLTAMMFAVQGFKLLPQKKQSEMRRIIQKSIEYRFPGEKFHSLDDANDALAVLRYLSNQKLREISFRDRRPHLIAENVEFIPNDHTGTMGSLRVSGYLRGKSLSVNGLVHLPGWGDYRMTQVDAPPDPYPLVLHKKTHKKQDVEMAAMSGVEAVKILEKADASRQESLESEVIPDPMEGEQTWPTEEELNDASWTTRVTRKVPKGTSDYQATWIPYDDSGQIDDESESESESIAEMDVTGDVADSASDDADPSNMDTVTMTDGDNLSQYDADFDIDEERNMLERIKDERSHQMFPDEVDTPMDVAARVRFARYRGLQSFRTSPWDPKENLPPDYARIFQFQRFNQTRKKAFADADTNGVQPGWYVTIHVADVDKSFMDTCSPGRPVVLFGLLHHEQKMSVANYMIRRCRGDTRTLKSKERLIFHVGFRRFTACPIFSQHSSAAKHKFERYLPESGTSIATVFAPIMFPKAPVLVFQQVPDGGTELVATGSLLSVDPDRVVVKRIVLSGHPFKINKRAAVIRYLFFNPDDVNWFKPVELRTKWGRRGHIKEALGTHGHMKCIFNGQLKSQDTVLMALYKRVFPKWTYNPQLDPVTDIWHPRDGTQKEAAYALFD